MNWTRYTYVCDPDSCDSLLEFTCSNEFGYPSGSIYNMKCPCGRVMQLITIEEAPAPILTNVSKVTPVEVVKINSNPYN
jgi:hypothetical protein